MRSAALLCLLGACTGSAGAELDVDAGADTDAMPDGPALPTADELRQRVAGCAMELGGPYAPGSGQPADISICGFPGAVVWRADLDVDCDGKETAQCNPQTDPYFMNQTAANDSNGDPLDAAALPFVVVPGPSMRFDFRDAGLGMGMVVAVVFEDRVEYGPLGDVGPAAYIGEASYAMAAALGIDPDPATGGTAGEVTYIAFTEAELATIEDHAAAVELGVTRARDLLAAP